EKAPRRTASPCGSTRKARSFARAASPSRVKAPRPSSRRSRPPRSACRSNACGSLPGTPTTRPMAAAPGPRARPASAGKPPGRPGKRSPPTGLPAPPPSFRPNPQPPTSPTAPPPIPPAPPAPPPPPHPPPPTAPPRTSLSGAAPPAGVARAVGGAPRHYVPRAWPFAFTNGVQASYLEVDTDSGIVKLLKHWCVEDCGTVINPQLVDEQIRGGV